MVDNGAVTMGASQEEQASHEMTRSKRRSRIAFGVCGAVFVVLVITLTVAFTANHDAWYTPNPFYQETLDEMGINSSSSDTEIQQAMEILAQHFLTSCPAGISVAVTRNDTRIIVPAGLVSINDPDHHNVTEDTLFEIGSVSKPLTGLVLAHQIVGGAISLDTPLNDLLPVSVPDLLVNDELVTFRQLVTHTAGFPRLSKNVRDLPNLNDLFGPNPYAGYNETDMLNEISIASQELSQTGEYAYSNFGFSVLGYLLGKSANTSFPQLQKELTDRLGMKDTWIELPNDARGNLSTGYYQGQEVPYWFDGGLFSNGAGSTVSSTRDLLNLVELLLSPEKRAILVDDDDLIDEALSLSLESLHEGSTSTTTTGDGDGGISFAWSYNGDTSTRRWSHGGSTAGFLTYVTFQPQSRTGVVVMSNCGLNFESMDLGNALVANLFTFSEDE